MSKDEERDELAVHLAAAYGDLEVRTPDIRAAESILAAGYSKPRTITITTVEELDALPVGSVVLSEGYTHHANEMPISFQRWTGGDWHRGARAGNTHPDNFLPATVLYTPEPTL